MLCRAEPAFQHVHAAGEGACALRQVEDALIMGADYYETLEECALIPGCLPMGLGALPAAPLREPACHVL